MPRRPLALVGAELSGRIRAFQIARTQLFDVDVDRKKRIDDAIDYFGAGHNAVPREGVRQAGLRSKSPNLSTSDQTSEPHGPILWRTATCPSTLRMGTAPRRFARETRASSPTNLALPVPAPPTSRALRRVPGHAIHSVPGEQF
jgi:hypothetical protein